MTGQPKQEILSWNAPDALIIADGVRRHSRVLPTSSSGQGVRVGNGEPLGVRQSTHCYKSCTDSIGLIMGNIGMVRDSAAASIKEPCRPLKVCFVSPLGYGLYNPQSGIPFGGAEVQFFLLATALANDSAYDVSVLTTVDHQTGIESQGRMKVYKRLGRRRMDPKSRQGIFDRFRD